MSFFDNLSKAANAIGEAAENQRVKNEARKDKLNSLLSRFESKSDKDLKEILKSNGLFGSSDDEKTVARKILRDRGY
jgi:hypothetical protein